MAERIALSNLSIDRVGAGTEDGPGVMEAGEQFSFDSLTWIQSHGRTKAVQGRQSAEGTGVQARGGFELMMPSS